jgi:iron complex transport system substrate-binding protein
MKKLIVSVCIMLTVLATASLVAAGSGEQLSSPAGPAMRTYQAAGYEVDIPVNPRRIVADYYVGELLKLEANLVGADLTYQSSAWELGDLTDVGQSMEAVLALEPDLIITINEDKVAQYSGIAPTVLIPYGTYNPEELVLALGDITGTADIAEQWIAGFNARIEELAALVPDTTETYTIIDVWGGNAYLYGEHFGRGGYILYNKLGLKGTPAAEQDYIRKPDSYSTLTVEALPEYAGDVVLLMSNEDPRSASSFFTENVVWENLPAVRGDSVLYLNSEDFWFIDPFSLDLQVEILMGIFADAE